MFRSLTLMALLLALAATGRAQFQLATASPANYGNHGIMFDVEAQQDLRLTGIEIYLDQGLNTVEIYRVTAGTTFVGVESTPAAWTLLDTVVVYGAGSQATTLLPSSLEINLEAGQRQGLYVTTQGNLSLYYELGANAGGIDVDNGSLAIREGVGKSYAFAGTNGSTTPGGTTRKFRGILHYDLGVIGAEQAASTLINPDDAEESMTFDIEAQDEDLVITGLSVHLSGGNSNLELWVTEAISSSGVAGTSFGNYRKIGEIENFFSAGGGQKVRLPMDFEVVVPAGQTRGFYLTTDGFASIQARNEAGNNAHTAVHGDLRIINGSSYANHFGTPLGFHTIDATVHYRKPTQLGGITPGLASSVQCTGVNSSLTRGEFHDLTATEDVVIESLSQSINPGTSYVIEVWAVTGGGSFIGKGSSPALWTRLSVENITVSSNPTTIASNLRLFIPAGGVQGIMIVGTSGFPLGFTTASGGATVAGSDGTVSVALGQGANAPFAPAGAINVTSDLRVNYRTLGHAENGFYENFQTASGIQAPAGWISSFVEGNREKLDGWRFDNPGGRTLGGELAAPVAICDSDDSGTGNPIDASLISPRFDASVGQITLNFSNRFRQYISSVGDVDVWNGSSWTNVAQYTTDLPAYEESLDITAACGGSYEAKVRFRYTGDYDWYWIIDNVHVQIGQAGQRPQLGIGEFDVNYARDAVYDQPVSSGLPGPYLSRTNIFQPTVFSWDGEPNQPLQLFVGNLNLANVVLVPQGQLDVGSYDPITNTFPGILLLGDGTANDLLNAAFRTSNAGRCTIPFYMPPYTVGQTFHFQSVVYSSTQNIALTNVVSLTVDP